VPAGTAADVDRAVTAARTAFPGWAATGPAERAAHLDRLHTALAGRADEIARTVALELGTPIKLAARVQTGLPLTVLRGYVELAARPPVEETVGNSLVVREPVGVVGAITPWNYRCTRSSPAGARPRRRLHRGARQRADPLVAYLLFDAVEEAGLPAGVVNLVPAPARWWARRSPHIRTSTWFLHRLHRHRPAVATAADGSPVALELGGKSANLILADADLATAVRWASATPPQLGQTCTAWTRMLVHRDRYAEALDLVTTAAEGYRLGDPFDPATRLGPLVCAAQRDRVRGHVERAIADGARLLVGGPDAPVPADGHFVAPTVFADVDPDSALAQEEVFGPVLAVIPFDDEDQAVTIANNSRYGLAGAVWSADTDRALAVARRLRTGAVDINGAPFNPLAPFGGYKQSGVGRELGAHGLAEFCETKAIQR
jgi:aldehyde dehydrogenase (NAD+)